MKTRGFTLIELLVVIAIIGLLSSIVLAALSTARAKGKDAAIQSDLHNAQAQAELLRDNVHMCYPGPSGCNGTNAPSASAQVSVAACGGSLFSLCSQPTIAAILKAAETASGGYVSLDTPAGGGAYAYAIQLVAEPSKAWCVDSSGNSTKETLTAQTQAGIDAVITSKSTCN